MLPEPTDAPNATEPLHEDVRHEGTDVSTRAISAFVIIMLAAIAVIALVLWLFLRAYSERLAAARPAPPMRVPDLLPAAPRLEAIDPAPTARQLYAPKEALLEQYGWVDRDERIVRIPIGEAMRLYAERAPVRADRDPPRRRVLVAPSDSNSGRTLYADEDSQTPEAREGEGPTSPAPANSSTPETPTRNSN